MDEDGLLARLYKPVALALVGAILVGVGVLGWRAWGGDETKVEIVESSGSSSSLSSSSSGQLANQVVVEVAGMVVNPGVYKLPFGSRVEDALVAAGGLGVNADRAWVEKYINRAQKLEDGKKIYVPTIEEMEKIAGEGASTQKMSNVQGSMSNKINVNTASMSELEELWGVGPATAKKIIDGRPFGKVEELLEKKIIKSNVFERIKDEVVAF